MLPKGWSSTALGNVMQFKNGLNFTKADAGEAIKIVGVADFKDHAELRSTEHLHTINVAGHIKDEELLINGDLLFVRSNGNKDLIGRCLFFPLVEERLSFSGFTIRGRANSNLALPEYLASVARSSFFKQQISQGGGGTNISNLSQQLLNEIKLPLPPLTEQKKISQILSTWDQAIATTERLLYLAHQQKKALMQQLLTGKKRLLSGNGQQFDGLWEYCTVDDFFKVGSSKRILQENWTDSGIPFYRTRELVSLSKNEPFRSEIYISEHLFDEITKEYETPSAGDFLVSGVGTLGICYHVKDGDRFYFKDGNVLWFKREGDIDSDFFYHCFQSDFIQKQITDQAAVTTVGTYTIQNAKKTKLYCPPTLEEQRKVATVLNSADQEIETLQCQLDGLKQEKKALMQALLTGKRRVQI